MKIASLFFFLILSCHLIGQDAQTIYFRDLYGMEKFDEIIKNKNKKGEALSAKSMYYIGMAYFMKGNDDMALKYLDAALAKGSVDHDMFYYKGMTLFYKGRYIESLPFFDSAIVRLPKEPDFYTGKGEVYYTIEKFDSAIYYFKKGLSFPNCKTRFILLLAESYQKTNRNKEAKESYKKGISLLAPSDENYSISLYNYGLVQLLDGDSNTFITFEKYCKLFPNDYSAMAKLIQSYYLAGKYEDAKPIRAQLYEAHKRKKLPSTMEEMFCFDQFIWNGHRVMVFERFDEPKKDLIVKHQFFILKDDGEMDYQVRSESSIAVRMTPGHKYVLCLVRDGSYSTSWKYIFNDDYKYIELKAAVITILDNDLASQNNSSPNQK